MSYKPKPWLRLEVHETSRECRLLFIGSEEDITSPYGLRGVRSAKMETDWADGFTSVTLTVDKGFVEIAERVFEEEQDDFTTKREARLEVEAEERSFGKGEDHEGPR